MQYEDDAAAGGAADATTPLPVELVDVAELPPASAAEGAVVRWSASNQLQTNVVTLGADAGVAWHVEPALDVTMLVGTVTLRHGPAGEDAFVVTATAPAVVVVRAGTRRSLSAGPAGVVGRVS